MISCIGVGRVRFAGRDKLWDCLLYELEPARYRSLEERDQESNKFDKLRRPRRK